MNALGFAWRSLVRQPARATLGVLGVAAVGALLLDMLLLSNGLVLSMGDLLDRVGFDVRVTASDALPGSGPRLRDVSALTTRIVGLPSVRAAATLLFGDAVIERVRLKPDTTYSDLDGANEQVRVGIQGAGGTARHPWTILRGEDTRGPRELVLNENAARLLGVRPGASIAVRASCSGDPDTRPPVSFRVTGIAEFPFDSPNDRTAGTDLSTLADVCGTEYADAADVIMVTSREGAGGAAQAAAAIAGLDPDLRALTNEQAIGRMQQRGFSYFRQISTVLSTVTLSFALLLITVLLTVSVNQRLGEIAALRALGFSQRRVVADVLCESSLIVGAGGLLSLPLGVLLATGLDRILKNMPGVPAQLHFFVFEGRALALHATLLVATAILAALYPMRIVARLPIAATLRDEVIS